LLNIDEQNLPPMKVEPSRARPSADNRVMKVPQPLAWMSVMSVAGKVAEPVWPST
jgi:hypothetical protein